MIRIDLKKGDLGNKGRRKTKIGPLDLDFDALVAVAAQKASRFSADLQTILILSIVSAVACLPHLFFSQYRTYLIRQHQARVDQMKEGIAAVEQELGKLSAFQAELDSYEKQKSQVSSRLTLVRELLNGRGALVSVLDALGQSLPARAWITNLDFNAVASDIPLKLTGSAFTNEDISDFADKLSDSTHLKDTKIEDVGNARDGDIEVRTFQISLAPKAKYLGKVNTPGKDAKAMGHAAEVPSSVTVPPHTTNPVPGSGNTAPSGSGGDSQDSQNTGI